METLTPRPVRFHTRTFGLGVLILLLALAGVWLAEWALQSSETDPEVAREEVVAEVQGRVDETLERIERRAREVAQDQELIESLQRLKGNGSEGIAASGAGTPTSPPSRLTAAAFSALSDLRSEGRFSAEVYDASLELVAWSGFSIPLRRRAALPDTVESHAVLDDVDRRALVVWVPVQSGSVTVGAVRAALLLQASVPVRNEYLQDYDIADRWRDEIGEYFQVAIIPTRQKPAPEAEPLLGVSDEVVGWLLVPGSSASDSGVRRGQFFSGFRALIAFFLMAWCVGGVGLLFLKVVRRSTEHRTRRNWMISAGAFFLVAGAVVMFRFGLLNLDIPVRWLDSFPLIAQFFNPAIFGSDVGWGMMRSPGDLAISVFLALFLAGSGLMAALRYSSFSDKKPQEGGQLRMVAGLVGAVAFAVVATGILGVVARHSVLDATLRYFNQTGPVLTGLFVAVLGSQVMLAAAAVLGIAGTQLVAKAGFSHRRGGWFVSSVITVGVIVLASVFLSFGEYVPPIIGMLLVVTGALLAFVLDKRPDRWGWPLTFSGIFLGVLILAPLAYGLMRAPLEEQRDARLSEAGRSFASERDSRVLYALEQMYAETHADDALQPILLDAIVASDSLRREGDAQADSVRQAMDELAAGLVTGSLLGSLSDVTAELRFLSPEGETLGAFDDDGTASLLNGHLLSFENLREQYTSGQEGGALIRSTSFEGRRGLRRYAGLGSLGVDTTGSQVWIYVRATPRPTRFAVETPFPRVLVPSEQVGLGDERFTYAEYEDGVLVRSEGAESAPFRLDTTVVQALEEKAGALWSTERIDGGRTRSFYERIGVGIQNVVSVRAPARGRIDTLFLLFRIALSGLIAGIGMYLLGLPIRHRIHRLYGSPSRFRDKVLNRFLVIGLLSVVLTGIVGDRVLSEQNRQSVQDLLRQRLDRAEALLTAGSSLGTPAGEVLAGEQVDAVIGTLDFDVHLYQGPDLLASSRRQLVRQRLIDSRLPASVYQDLFVEGESYAFSDDRIGSFRYTTGYRALPDASGRPVGAIAVPTLPEQTAIEAGQARLVAYLFGGLLILLIVIAGIGVLLAGQLTRPFERLRQGLEAVGKGRLDEPIPVETRDEVGQLAESFNTMQAQLAESRRLLAEQERETAWSEMARQVAHEIKNPLMPMLLAVQHLQRLYRDPGEDATPEESRFSTAFRRTTQMLVEQIESLKRIASEFSVFARLPERYPEGVDLNEVVKEAARLFQSEMVGSGPQNVSVSLDLSSRSLPVLADREEIRRVFVNLLTNAFQALDGKAGNISLHTGYREFEQGELAVVEVTDTGHGISPESRSRIFQPSFSTKTSGMGLGLAIAKRSVEAAGGTIGFESEPGEGTTFRVRLPMTAEAKPESR